MKAISRPTRLLFKIICLLAMFMVVSVAIAPADLLAKTRPEVQLGDPTDTDPGPASGNNKNTGKFDSHSSSFMPFGRTTWFELYRLMANLFRSYRHP